MNEKPQSSTDEAPEGGEPVVIAAAAPKERGWLRSPHLWVSTTYFAEGFPYAVVNNLAEILFKELGASLQVIGLTSLFHLPWNLKFAWGPLIDNYETKRRWLLGIELTIVVLLVVLGVLAAWAGSSLTPIAIAFLILGLLSATHDIAIDGYYLEALDLDGQSRFVGDRAAAYRIAVLVVGGPLVWLCAKLGWVLGLELTALCMAGLLAYHAVALPRVEGRGRPWVELLRALTSWRALPLLAAAVVVWGLERVWAVGVELVFAWRAMTEAAPWLGVVATNAAVGYLLLAVWLVFAALLAVVVVFATVPAVRQHFFDRRERGELSDYGWSFVSFLAQPKVGVMLAFVMLFRTGESFLQKMRWPFLDDVVHLQLESYGLLNGTIGVLASFAATIFGGRMIARDGLRRWIWPFVLAQNLLNLLYMGVALVPDPSSLGVGVLALVITLEHAGAGLGTAVFMVYLMRTCDPEHKAGHFAIVSALMSVGFTFAGVVSGVLAEALGFATYFGFTFLATLPMMALIFFVPHLDGREDS